MVRLQEGGALRAGKEDRWQRRQEQPVGLGLTQQHTEIIARVAPGDRAERPALRLQRGEVGLQRVRPRGRIEAGGIERALLRAGMAESRRQILERGLHVLHPTGGQYASGVQGGEEVGKRHAVGVSCYGWLCAVSRRNRRVYHGSGR